MRRLLVALGIAAASLAVGSTAEAVPQLCTGGARLYPIPQGGTAQCSDWSRGGWVQAAPFCTDAYGNGLTVLGPKTSYGVSRRTCPFGAPYIAYAGVRRG